MLIHNTKYYTQLDTPIVYILNAIYQCKNKDLPINIIGLKLEGRSGNVHYVKCNTETIGYFTVRTIFNTIVYSHFYLNNRLAGKIYNGYMKGLNTSLVPLLGGANKLYDCALAYYGNSSFLANN